MAALLLACVLFRCGPLSQPRVALVFVNTGPDAATVAGVRAIVEDGYLPSPGTLVLAPTLSVAALPWGYLWTIHAEDLAPSVVRDPGTITLFVLDDALRFVPPDAGCLGGCLVTGSWHGLSDGIPCERGGASGLCPDSQGIRWGVVSPRLRAPLRELGYPDTQPVALYDAAHELVEAAEDAEIADACEAAPLVAFRGYRLPAYEEGDECHSP